MKYLILEGHDLVNGYDAWMSINSAFDNSSDTLQQVDKIKAKSHEWEDYIIVINTETNEKITYEYGRNPFFKRGEHDKKNWKTTTEQILIGSDDPDPDKCPKCQENEYGDAHLCPYALEIDGVRTYCTCCEECTEQCAENI